MNYWRDFHDRFMALKAEEIQIIQQHAPRFHLRATGQYGGVFTYGRWEISHQVNDNFQARFELVCADVARFMGCPDSVHPVTYWLHSVFCYLRDKSSRRLVALGIDYWQIDNLCENSATLCARLEMESLYWTVKPARTVELPVTSPATAPDAIARERTALLDAYKREGKEHDIRITDKMVAKAASSKWNERTPVQRWKRNDPRCTAGDDAKIRSVLKKKPHLQG